MGQLYTTSDHLLSGGDHLPSSPSPASLSVSPPPLAGCDDTIRVVTPASGYDAVMHAF